MKTTHWISSTGLALLAALMSLSWIQSRRAHAWEANRADVDREFREAEQAIRQAEQRIYRLNADEGALRAELEKMSAKRNAQPAKRAIAATPHGRSLSELLRTEPEMQALWLISRRAELATRYGPLMRQLNLSAEQRVRFEAIERRREEHEFDLHAVEGSNGISKNEPAVLTLRKQVQTEYDDSMRALLGEEGLQRKMQYDRTALMREMVNGIAGGAVVVARIPFRADQGERLIQIMANASESYRKGGQASSGDLNWDLIDAQARTLLSDAQFAVFKTMEPPLPLGARHQAQLYRLVDEAKKKDISLGPKTPGR